MINDQILDGKSQSPNQQEKDSECRQISDGVKKKGSLLSITTL